MERKKVLTYTIISFLCIAPIHLFQTPNIKATQTLMEIYPDIKIPDYSIDFLPSLFLTPHAPIEIISDDNFTDYGFPGYGNVTHPYIIENYKINATGEYGIHIKDTTKYFLIQECYISNTDKGIFIEELAHDRASITDNFCTNNIYGIYMDSCLRSKLTNNTCVNNTEDGIKLWYSDLTIISNNTCNSNAENGMYFIQSGNLVITNNTCVNNSDAGMEIADSYSSDLTRNSCNNNSAGIILIDCDRANLIENLCSYNTGDGILLHSVPRDMYVTITNNTFSYNEGTGIDCRYGDALIANNTCINNFSGIAKKSNSYDDHLDTVISDNICSNNTVYGIFLWGVSEDILLNNICENNKVSGIILSHCSFVNLTSNYFINNDGHGIYVELSSSSFIHKNNIINNKINGIMLEEGTSSFLLTKNLLKDNEAYGIFLVYDSKEDYSASKNTIYHNEFIDNNPGGTSQGFDSGDENKWFNPETREGNWWSDLNGKCRYRIDGDANSKDKYPLNRTSSCFTIPFVSILIADLASTLILFYIVPKYIIPKYRKV